VAVVMAGNPYTESGENGGHFELSYIENAMTSNAVLQSLNNKSRNDLFPMLQLAGHGDRDGLEFEGSFGVEETQEIVGGCGRCCGPGTWC
jgi:hypothetical protein